MTKRLTTLMTLQIVIYHDQNKKSNIESYTANMIITRIIYSQHEHYSRMTYSWSSKILFDGLVKNFKTT